MSIFVSAARRASATSWSYSSAILRRDSIRTGARDATLSPNDTREAPDVRLERMNLCTDCATSVGQTSLRCEEHLWACARQERKRESATLIREDENKISERASRRQTREGKKKKKDLCVCVFSERERGRRKQEKKSADKTRPVPMAHTGS